MSYQQAAGMIARTTGLALRLVLIALMAMPGCALRRSEQLVDADLEHYKTAATQIEYPDVVSETFVDHASTPPPITLTDQPTEYWEMSLEEVIQRSLGNSRVLRDLGGQVLQFPGSPEIVRTTLDPAIRETDPRFGVEAALSAFDTSFEASAFFENNDRALNNVFFGGGTRILQQDLHAYQAELSKRSATGGEFTMRKIIEYDSNNSPGNNDPNLPWTVLVESEFRQPLLQGAGVDFNRIAGPNGTVGAMNGVLVARINTDISLADFEIGIRNLVNDVESAYWELYYAYRDLDVKIEARDRALTTWRQIYALYVNGQRGGEQDREAQARAQYYRLEEEVQNALTGRFEDRSRTLVFRGAGGVHAMERRLRLLMGVPMNDGRLIRPIDEPMMARVIFNWDEVLTEALTRRVELRQQKWRIKSRELEMLATKNFLLPRVDAVGRYRFRGLGHELLNSTRDRQRFDNAYQDLTTGDFQEWQLGVEVEVPIGYRQAHSAVRNAELLLARDRAILEEQEREIIHDLSAAIAEVTRAYQTAQTNYNRRIAEQQQLEALMGLYEEADPNEKSRLFDLLMDSQRRLSDGESRYYRSLVEYTMAVKNVHLQKGSLLEYNQVFMAEGPWPGKAYFDAAEREFHRREPSKFMNYLMTKPWPVSRGTLEQRVSPGETLPTPHTFPPMQGEELPVPTVDPAAEQPLEPIPHVAMSDEFAAPVEPGGLPASNTLGAGLLGLPPAATSWPAGSSAEGALVPAVVVESDEPELAAPVSATRPVPQMMLPHATPRGTAMPQVSFAPPPVLIESQPSMTPPPVRMDFEPATGGGWPDAPARHEQAIAPQQQATAPQQVPAPPAELHRPAMGAFFRVPQPGANLEPQTQTPSTGSQAFSPWAGEPWQPASLR